MMIKILKLKMQCRSFSSILWNFGKKLEKFGLMTKKIVLNSINKLPINKLQEQFQQFQINSYFLILSLLEIQININNQHIHLTNINQITPSPTQCYQYIIIASKKQKKPLKMINPFKQHQLNIQYNKHRLEINNIRYKQNSSLKKSQQQKLLMTSRNAYRQYNTTFKRKQSAELLQRRNSVILSRLEFASRVKRPNSSGLDQLRTTIARNKSFNKKNQNQFLITQNFKLLKKLINVKPTISIDQHNISYTEHAKRSQMLSKFTKNKKGNTIPKSFTYLEKRMKLEFVFKKLSMIESKIGHNPHCNCPLKFNSMKLFQMNPEII